MGFNNFRVNIVLRIFALLGTMFILIWGYTNTDWKMTIIVCAIMVFLQVLEFVHYAEMSNRQLSNFLLSISAKDFSTRFNAIDKGESFEDLASAYNLITREFTRINIERAEKHKLLEALIEHISTALLCIDEAGKIILMNQSAKNLFRSPYIQNTFALSKVDKELPKLIENATPGQNQLIKLNLHNEVLPVSMFTTKFYLSDNAYSLVSFQNIRDELEMRELDSWQKLIKVLTHEIMNSVTPIVSLTSVIKEMLISEEEQIKPSALSPVESKDLIRSLLAIEARGNGLMRFVQSYNNLANFPEPIFNNIDLAKLLDRISLLMQPELNRAGITLDTQCTPEKLSLFADPQQLEQILINLVKNAREAMPENVQGKIHISANKHPTRGIVISVVDNGSGIEPELLQNIFIPFYTSKKQGSGIGLSISRQLTLANKGSLTATSQLDQGSEFTLTFRYTESG